jgi:hypothetical protein
MLIFHYLLGRFLKIPIKPFGANVTKNTNTPPTINKFQEEESVTEAACWIDPNSKAPTNGPNQEPRPPTMGMAILFTAYDKLNVAVGST